MDLVDLDGGRSSNHWLVAGLRRCITFGFLLLNASEKKPLIRTDFEEEIGTSTDSIEPRV